VERLVPPGVHGLSNHLLDTPWSKVVVAKSRLDGLLQSGSENPEDYFEILSDKKIFPDELLPDTGVGIERERRLSPIFVSGRSYGTRFSTLIFIDRKKHARFLERRYKPRGMSDVTTAYNLVLES